MKKYWSSGLISGLILLFGILIPSYASAGILSFFTGNTAKAADTTSIQSNSDSSLLSAATNSNPSKISNTQLSIDNGALIASSGEAGTVSDIATTPQTTTISLYVVREGDSLSQIAKMFGVSVNTIIWANDITGPVHVGDKLVILPITGVEYTVKKGDTVASIAKKFNVDVLDISQFNGVANSTLAVGEIIIVPDGELASTQPIILRQGKITNANLPPEPLHNANGPSYPGYYAMPIAIGGACLSQGLHGYNAVDIAHTPKGTPIYATAAGTVIVARNNGGWNGGYGNYVVISHDNGTQTLYGHASKVLVSSGDLVAQGEEIALVGATGEATGPHLHIEVRGAQNPFIEEYPSCY